MLYLREHPLNCSWDKILDIFSSIETLVRIQLNSFIFWDEKKGKYSYNFISKLKELHDGWSYFQISLLQKFRKLQRNWWIQVRRRDSVKNAPLAGETRFLYIIILLLPIARGNKEANWKCTRTALAKQRDTFLGNDFLPPKEATYSLKIRDRMCADITPFHKIPSLCWNHNKNSYSSRALHAQQLVQRLYISLVISSLEKKRRLSILWTEIKTVKKSTRKVQIALLLQSEISRKKSSQKSNGRGKSDNTFNCTYSNCQLQSLGFSISKSRRGNSLLSRKNYSTMVMGNSVAVENLLYIYPFL